MNRKRILISLLAIVFAVVLALFIFNRPDNKVASSNGQVIETVVEVVESTECYSIEIETETTCAPTLSYDEQFNLISKEISTLFESMEYTPDLDKAALDMEIRNLELYREKLKNIYSSYPEEFSIDIEELVSTEIAIADKLLEQYAVDYENIRIWNQHTEEYPVATHIWLFMKEQGWNDYVCAGIMGNMMVESGEHSLNIDPYNWDDATGRSFYGICQWGHYYKEIHNCDLDTQLNYLISTIEGEFDYAGFCYYSGFTYGDFLNMTNCRDAALAFAKVYERCGSSSYSARQYCAQLAYSYFVG